MSENTNKKVETSHQICYTCICIQAPVNIKEKNIALSTMPTAILLGFRKNAFKGRNF